MQYFTPSEMQIPSERTLSIIRSIAYAYNESRPKGNGRQYLLN